MVEANQAKAALAGAALGIGTFLVLLLHRGKFHVVQVVGGGVVGGATYTILKT